MIVRRQEIQIAKPPYRTIRNRFESARRSRIDAVRRVRTVLRVTELRTATSIHIAIDSRGGATVATIIIDAVNPSVVLERAGILAWGSREERGDFRAARLATAGLTTTSATAPPASAASPGERNRWHQQ